MKRLVYIDGQQAVIYRTRKPNPSLGQNFEAMNPLEWLARMADQIPHPGKHRILFYGYHANRVRDDRERQASTPDQAEQKAPKKRRCTASWARLISKGAAVERPIHRRSVKRNVLSSQSSYRGGLWDR